MRSTRAQRDGTNQYDARQRKHMKLIAHFDDGTSAVVPTLVEMIELRKIGTVIRFEKVEV